MRFALSQKILTFALAAVAAFPLAISGEIGLGWAISLPVLGVLGWMLEPPLTREKRFRRVVTGLVIAIFAVQLARVAMGEQMAKMGMEFAVALLGIKLCSRGFASDYSQIVILAFMHIIAATVAMYEISYGFSFLIFVALCPPVLALSYLRREMEHRFGEGNQKDGPEMLERLLRSKRVISPGFVVGSSLLSLPIILITAVLFITFPRIGLGLFGYVPQNQAMVGFGSQVMLGDIDLVRADSTVLIRMEPFGFERKLPAYLPMKIRGAIFDVYQGNTWKKSLQFDWRKVKRHGNDFPLDDDHFTRDKSQGFYMLLESMDPATLFVPEGTGLITTYPIATGGRPQPRVIEQNSMGALRYKNEANVGIRYKVHLTGSSPYGPPPDEKHDYLQLPAGSDRLMDLATRFAGSGTPKERAKNIISQLQKNYSYSTQISSSEANALAKTPLERFLFTRKTGTCEHFATSLTLMLRAVGIPARLVTGLSGIDWNPIGNYYTARSQTAHSWTEAFLDGKWVTLDATPPGEMPVFQTWYPQTVSMYIDTIRMRWHKHIVGYDASSQWEVAMGLWRFWKRVSAPAPTKVKVAPWPVWAAIVGAVAIGIIVWLKKFGPKFSFTSRMAKKKSALKEATKLYHDLERRLARLGYPRPLNRTPEEHADLVGFGALALRDSVRRVTDRYNAVRFGKAEFAAGELEALKLEIKSLHLP